MLLAVRGIHDVLYRHTSRNQRIGDQRAMASPGQCLSTHDGDLFLPGQVDQHLHTLLKLRRLHVIGIASE